MGNLKTFSTPISRISDWSTMIQFHNNTKYLKTWNKIVEKKFLKFLEVQAHEPCSQRPFNEVLTCFPHESSSSSDSMRMYPRDDQLRLWPGLPRFQPQLHLSLVGCYAPCVSLSSLKLGKAILHRATVWPKFICIKHLEWSYQLRLNDYQHLCPRTHSRLRWTSL